MLQNTRNQNVKERRGKVAKMQDQKGYQTILWQWDMTREIKVHKTKAAVVKVKGQIVKGRVSTRLPCNAINNYNHPSL